MKTTPRATKEDRFGLVRPVGDAHTLGIMSVGQALLDAGYEVFVGDAAACEAFGRPDDTACLAAAESWIRGHRITVLGFSYRLDPHEGSAVFERLVYRLKSRGLFVEQGGPLKAVCFAGLPAACEIVSQRVPEVAACFCGDESPVEVLTALGVPRSALPASLTAGAAYDEARLAFGSELIRKGDYLGVRPVDRSGYAGFGTRSDTLIGRLEHAGRNDTLPLMRAHVGPYGPQREEAVRLFLDWTRRLAKSGLLDVLSIGTSQLTQSHFGDDWTGMANGGGVPLNSADEFAAVWQAARPMLVRTYAGTKNTLELARMYEDAICMAWHTMSLWWFCRIDGRGPRSVRENLDQHIQTIRYVASVGKPFEPNVPHHFSFRGGDDVTYVVSGVLAAKTAKALGIRSLVLQNMLNTPKATWGVQDLAKSRAMLQLIREFEDETFRVILQPRAGLDYLSPDLQRAKAQLAAVTALMDDIEPGDERSPAIIHVVSHSEASHLADPDVVDESIRITRHALGQYRALRAKGQVDDMTSHPEVVSRTADLLAEARTVLAAIESSIPSPCSAEGLYQALERGFLVVPHLWECRDEFSRAVRWQTRLVEGAVKVVDGEGRPILAAARMRMVLDDLRQSHGSLNRR